MRSTLAPRRTLPTLRSGGVVARLVCESARVQDTLLQAAGRPSPLGALPHADVSTVVTSRCDLVAPVGTVRPVSRGVGVDERGGIVLRSAGGSGYAQYWTVTGEELRVTSTWCPSAPERAAAAALPVRTRALRAQVLLHHPVLWRAALDGLSPLHVSVVDVAGVPTLLAGPGGVGKSTLVARELALGAVATCDNLGTSDGRVVHGLAEPLRLPPLPGERVAHGSAAAHGRVDHPWARRRVTMRPRLVVVVSRGAGPTQALPVTSRAAARAITAGTFAAGELSRFWPLCATLAHATGLGDAVPPVPRAATMLADALPCLELRVGPDESRPLRVLLHDHLPPASPGASVPTPATAPAIEVRR